MTRLSDIEKIDRDWLTPAQIATVLGADPNWIRWQARNNKDALGFPVIVYGSRVKIPKLPFLKFMLGSQ